MYLNPRSQTLKCVPLTTCYIGSLGHPMKSISHGRVATKCWHGVYFSASASCCCPPFWFILIKNVARERIQLGGFATPWYAFLLSHCPSLGRGLMTSHLGFLIWLSLADSQPYGFWQDGDVTWHKVRLSGKSLWARQLLEVFGPPSLTQNAECSLTTVETFVYVPPHLPLCEITDFKDSLSALASSDWRALILSPTLFWSSLVLLSMDSGIEIRTIHIFSQPECMKVLKRG